MTGDLQNGTPDVSPFPVEPAPAGVLVQLTPHLRRMVVPNPGPMTSTGTCTYILGRGKVSIVDPGPVVGGHMDTLLDALRGESVDWVIGTHTHIDHTPAAVELCARTGAKRAGCTPFQPAPGQPMVSWHDAQWQPDLVLTDGDVFEGHGFTLETVATPGHAANHLAFRLREDNALLSGDHVMAWSTSVVIPPDGHMGAYIASLEKLRAREEALYWPGHGGPVLDPQRYVRGIVQHRRQREATILSRLLEGDRTIAEITARLYQSTNPALLGAASRTVWAHLCDMVERGMVRSAPDVPTLDGEYWPT